MRRSRWRRTSDWLRSFDWWPVYYRVPSGSSWWSWRGRFYRVRINEEGET